MKTPSASGTKTCSSITSGRSSVEAGADGHIGITAPARAYSGMRSIGVSATTKHGPVNRSPVCQSYHSPAGR